MKTFEYIVTAEDGLHARPAGGLVNLAKKFNSDITIKFGEKEASLKKLFALMKLGINKGDKITILFTGDDEEKAFEEISTSLKENY